MRDAGSAAPVACTTGHPQQTLHLDLANLAPLLLRRPHFSLRGHTVVAVHHSVGLFVLIVYQSWLSVFLSVFLLSLLASRLVSSIACSSPPYLLPTQTLRFLLLSALHALLLLCFSLLLLCFPSSKHSLLCCSSPTPFQPFLFYSFCLRFACKTFPFDSQP